MHCRQIWDGERNYEFHYLIFFNIWCIVSFLNGLLYPHSFLKMGFPCGLPMAKTEKDWEKSEDVARVVLSLQSWAYLLFLLESPALAEGNGKERAWFSFLSDPCWSKDAFKIAGRSFMYTTFSLSSPSPSLSPLHSKFLFFVLVWVGRCMILGFQKSWENHSVPEKQRHCWFVI